jgi:hypothetical protein
MISSAMKRQNRSDPFDVWMDEYIVKRFGDEAEINWCELAD